MANASNEAAVHSPQNAAHNRAETSFKEITDQMELARHGAHTFEGLLTRTIATLAAHTLLPTQLSDVNENLNSHNAPKQRRRPGRRPVCSALLDAPR